MLELRDYQQQAVDRIIWARTLDGNDLCVLPTGSGKSIVIAKLAEQIGEDILILQPSKEILEQNAGKLANYVDKDEIGIYSASLKQKVIKKYTLATIGSVYRKPEFFTHFKTVLIDECHLVNVKNLSGMFTKFLSAIGSPKVVGFTATPYRMGLTYKYVNGYLNGVTAIKLINRVRPKFWDRIIFNINNEDLTKQGYLCPIEYIDKTIIPQEEIPLNKSHSDFDLAKYWQRINQKCGEIVDAVLYAEAKCTSVLVFCTSIAQAEALQRLVPNSTMVTGTTPPKLRSKIINDFKEGKTKTVFNVGVLTTGFDHPALDCIVLGRPTRSIALYYQMVGRGVRTFPGKTSCKVIDLTNTVKSLGRIESIKMVRDKLWELVTETGSWHGKELYSFQIDTKKKEDRTSAQTGVQSSFL